MGMNSFINILDKVLIYVIVDSIFLVQDPLIVPPTRKEFPDFDVEPFFKWIQYISLTDWNPGKNIYGEKQIVGLKDQHSDKLHIISQKSGGGFQYDALCDDG